MDEAKDHQRLFHQTCQGMPSPDSLRKTLRRITNNPEYAERVAAELDLQIQRQRLRATKEAR